MCLKIQCDEKSCKVLKFWRKLNQTRAKKNARPPAALLPHGCRSPRPRAHQPKGHKCSAATRGGGEHIVKRGARLLLRSHCAADLLICWRPTARPSCQHVCRCQSDETLFIYFRLSSSEFISIYKWEKTHPMLSMKDPRSLLQVGVSK